MTLITRRRLLIVACISLWTRTGLANSHESGYVLSGLCPRSPLLINAQAPLGDWQCSLSNNSQPPSNTTSQQSTPQDEEADDSAGWTGPHHCAGVYCVYTHPTFASNRGIALITDSTTANALANLPLFVTLADPKTAPSVLNTNTQSAHVETRPIPGKGRGLVVKDSALHRGEQIMAYTPALILHRSLIDDLTRAEQLALLRDAVSRLPEPTKISFWKQLSQTGSNSNEDDILEIIMNNSFNLPAAPEAVPAPLIGNFPEVSMYNHDCRPNTAFHLAHGGFLHRTTVAASSHLLPGEELSISYVDSFRTHAVRNARTMRNWGFTCSCAICTAGGDAGRNASDNRLWWIYEVENSLFINQRSRREGKNEQEELDAVELLVSLYRQERLLESHGAVMYRVVAMVCSAWKRKELAIKWALLALDAYLVEEGEGSEGLREVVALLEAPEKHWSWGRRWS